MGSVGTITGGNVDGPRDVLIVGDYILSKCVGNNTPQSILVVETEREDRVFRGTLSGA